MNYKIYDGAKIIKKENLSIGDYSQIDDFVFFKGLRKQNHQKT
ncbi:hypothetical protein [Neisseria meningitidis]|nr:hypothetical protein [Neisseria meningitidis]